MGKASLWRICAFIDVSGSLYTYCCQPSGIAGLMTFITHCRSSTYLIVFRNRTREFNWYVLPAAACASLRPIISDALLEKDLVGRYHSEHLELLEVTIEKLPIVTLTHSMDLRDIMGIGCLCFLCIPFYTLRSWREEHGSMRSLNPMKTNARQNTAYYPSDRKYFL